MNNVVNIMDVNLICVFNVKSCNLLHTVMGADHCGKIARGGRPMSVALDLGGDIVEEGDERENVEEKSSNHLALP
ncbi:hypothetical protein L6452_39153 [Arctium lappa]|uniref:Uncharacterized protein n=1 Tax=Arctium lappa TaxID=4217 RepID=A0ACB8XS19_ARCLA|nr:hypothetical protein L6452_39153 [Arctium lappa]